MSSNNHNKPRNLGESHAPEVFQKYIAELSARGEKIGIDEIMKRLIEETRQSRLKKSLKQITQNIRQLLDNIGF